MSQLAGSVPLCERTMDLVSLMAYAICQFLLPVTLVCLFIGSFFVIIVTVIVHFMEDDDDDDHLYQHGRVNRNGNRSQCGNIRDSLQLTDMQSATDSEDGNDLQPAELRSGGESEEDNGSQSTDPHSVNEDDNGSGLKPTASQLTDENRESSGTGSAGSEPAPNADHPATAGAPGPDTNRVNNPPVSHLQQDTLRTPGVPPGRNWGPSSLWTRCDSCNSLVLRRPQDLPEDPPACPWVCPLDAMRFAYRCMLHKHLHTHTNVVPLRTCTTCQTAYDFPEGYLRDVRVPRGRPSTSAT